MSTGTVSPPAEVFSMPPKFDSFVSLIILDIKYIK
jgi:hypothetical protein